MFYRKIKRISLSVNTYLNEVDAAAASPFRDRVAHFHSSEM